MDITPILICSFLFVGLPWLILHYVTKWKQAPRMTDEDEKLLDEMYNLARRLEERLNTVERIIAADNPDWKPLPPTREPHETYQSFESLERTRRI
jgi:phage shock protein B